MKVITRSGREEPVDFSEIQKRILYLSNTDVEKYRELVKRDLTKEEEVFTTTMKPLLNIDVVEIAKRVVAGLKDHISTQELDDLAAELCASMGTIHPEYLDLASRICVSNMHKHTHSSILHTYEELESLLEPTFLKNIREHWPQLDQELDHMLDYNYVYMAVQLLTKKYLLKVSDSKKDKRNMLVMERPQHMHMRVAIHIHTRPDGTLDMESVLKTYRATAQHRYTHASPTLFNAGTKQAQLASCFLLSLPDSSLNSVYGTLHKCATISSSAGGIGLCLSAKHTSTTGSGGNDTLVQLLKLFNESSKYVSQGGNKRPGAMAMYLSMHHPELLFFLDILKNNGNEELRARELFTALWIPDLFMERLLDKLQNPDKEVFWSLFCPKETSDLEELYGEEFNKKYEKYESEKKYTERVDIMDIASAIYSSLKERGMPYILFKDACNRKSNQKSLGTIKCSNLCTEIIQYSGRDEIAVCNLTSICLPACVVNGEFSYEALGLIVEQIVFNLNRVIDTTAYPLEECKRSNLKHRPMGIGVQGLANVYFMMNLAFESAEASRINKLIFECIYYHALKASCDLAQKHGPYESFAQSPTSRGILQFDMWPADSYQLHEELFNWSSLRANIAKHGLRNSLLVALMPTASTSHLLGNVDSFEPMSNNLYTFKSAAGDFQKINTYMVADLMKEGLWTPENIDLIKINRGSVQQVPGLSAHLKEKYKTVWEVSQRKLISMSADRAPFIDQSQSLNLYMIDYTFDKFKVVLSDAYRLGLKTCSYYTHTRPVAEPIQFTVSPRAIKSANGSSTASSYCTSISCDSCSS